MAILQNILVLMVVAAAGIYVIRMVWRMFSGRHSCSCGSTSCGQKDANTDGVVPLKLERRE